MNTALSIIPLLARASDRLLALFYPEICQVCRDQRATFAEPDTALISHVLVRKPLQNDVAATRLAKEKAETILAKIKLQGPTGFEKAANDAKAGCPVSRVLNAKITMDAKLEG